MPQMGIQPENRARKEDMGIFHAKIGTTKDKNGMDLTEAEDIVNHLRPFV